MGAPSLLIAFDYLGLLVDERPGKYPLAALGRHAGSELKAPTLILPESLSAIAVLVGLGSVWRRGALYRLARAAASRIEPGVTPVSR